MNSISEFLNQDHFRLDNLWSVFLKEEQSIELASEHFDKFKKHIVKHIRLENTFLFPKFDKYLGFEENVGPTTVLRHDHEIILKLLDIVDRAFQTQNLDLVMAQGENLQLLLEKHRQRENDYEYHLYDKIIDLKDFKLQIVNVYGVDF